MTKLWPMVSAIMDTVFILVLLVLVMAVLHLADVSINDIINAARSFGGI